MTTPAGVSNLPLGALTVETLGQSLQNQTPAAYRGRAADRMPELFSSSNGGNPLNDATPFGLITRVWSEVISRVATADPADIQGPDDIPGLLVDFVRSLPVVGELMGLLDAILGKYTGTDEILLAIQEIFNPIRKLLQLIGGKDVGWPTLEEITRGWGQLIQSTIDRIQQVLEAIWNGVGGLGDWIVGIFDPERARRAMEETQRRIAEAVAQIGRFGGSVEQFATYPAGSSLGPKWDQHYSGGPQGLVGIKEGVAQFVKPADIFGGRTALARFKTPMLTDDQRVEVVCATAPTGGTYLEIHARANEANNSRVFARLYKDKYELGCVSTAYYDEHRYQITNTAFRFQPAVSYALVVKTVTSLTPPGTRIELWEGPRLVESVLETGQWSVRGPYNLFGGFALHDIFLAQAPKVSAYSYRDQPAT